VEAAALLETGRRVTSRVFPLQVMVALNGTARSDVEGHRPL